MHHRNVRVKLPGYTAFLASILTYTLHLGHCTRTGRRLRERLASRDPMYVHSWLQRWQQTVQLEYMHPVLAGGRVLR